VLWAVVVASSMPSSMPACRCHRATPPSTGALGYQIEVTPLGVFIKGRDFRPCF
jgi:hypothetical protein